MRVMRLVLFMTGLAVMVSGCAGYRATRHAEHLLNEGQTREGVQALANAATRYPSTERRIRYIRERDQAITTWMREAGRLESQNRHELALARYQDVLVLNPDHADAAAAITRMSEKQRLDGLYREIETKLQVSEKAQAHTSLQQLLRQAPDYAPARRLLATLETEQQQLLLNDPVLQESFRKPVTLEFRNAPVSAVMEVLSRSSGINFIFDRDVKADLKTTIFARQTSIEDALDLILRTTALRRKVLNENTVLIYPDTAEKTKQYDDLVVRSFYLGNADAKKMQELVKAVANPKAMFMDDRKNVLIVRDTLPAMEMIDRLVTAYDIAEPEVLLDVEIMEISSDKLLNLGIQYPDAISGSIIGAAAKSGQMTLREWQNFDRDNVQLSVNDPAAIINLKKTDGNSNTLANPRIRVRNKEKAKILIGDKVPVVTTTTNQTSGSLSESVSYLDVGLKLEVEPEIHVGNDVSIGVSLEVSNIVKEVKSSSGLLTYQIGTRNASTTLRLKDGETQVLAGLIKREGRDSASRLPGLGDLPLIGRLFSNETNTRNQSEIVLLITPHVVRSLQMPPSNAITFASGSGSDIGNRALRIRSAPSEKKPTPSTTPSGTGSETAPPTPVLPASTYTTPLKLDWIVPARIKANQEFTVTVMGNGAAFDVLDFTIKASQPGLQLVSASPVGDYTTETSEQQDGINVRISEGIDTSGPLVVLTLKLDATVTSSTLNLEMQGTTITQSEITRGVASPGQRSLNIN